MEQRGLVSRVLLFVAGTAAIVLLVFVALPWLETPAQEKDQPASSDPIVEGVLASYGEEESSQGRETDSQAEEAEDLTAFPSPLLPVDVDSPLPGPAMEPPETTAFMTSGALPSESERETDKEDNPAAVNLLTEKAQAVVESTVEGAPSHMAVNTVEPLHAESVVAERATPPAPAAPEVVNPPALTRIEPMPAVKRVRVEPPRSGEAFRRAQAARVSSRAGLPRLEFEMPDTGEAMMTPVEPLSEFSPRPLARPHRPLAAETPAPDAGQSGPVQAPHILRGVMGYRLPLISHQELPDQVVSGVLIPAHTTYVILQPGYWELVGLSPDDVDALRAAVEKAKADQQRMQAEPVTRGWNPFRLFRTKRTPVEEN